MPIRRNFILIIIISLINRDLWNNFCSYKYDHFSVNSVNMKSYLLLLIFSVILFSCHDQTVVLKQKVYFEKHYINMAWIPQSTGFLIDSTGTVRGFSWIEISHVWYDPDSTGTVTVSNMDKNISFCQTENVHINSDTLALYVSKIEAASKGHIAAPQPVMADAGTTTYSAFILDEKNNRYKQVLIKTTGDFLTVNNAPEAEQIYRWMVRIGNTP